MKQVLILQHLLKQLIGNGYVDNRCWAHSNTHKQILKRFDQRSEHKWKAFMNVGDVLRRDTKMFKQQQCDQR